MNTISLHAIRVLTTTSLLAMGWWDVKPIRMHSLPVNFRGESTIRVMDYLCVQEGKSSIMFMFNCELNAGLDRVEVAMKRWQCIG